MRFSVLALAMLALAGCTVGPNYHQPAAIVPASYKELAGWTVAKPEAAINRGAWWSIYNDPTLDRLESQVAVNNQTIKAAAAAYAEARALVDEARAGFYPTLGANGGISRQSSGRGNLNAGGTFAASPIATDTYTLEGSGAWDLDLWGKVRRQVQSNVAAAEVSAA
ncbi:MAG TPA: TolC family protein, partial [Burkholderiales bacterium]|nr:TolC family protein [Burkholderiales bacterium]